MSILIVESNPQLGQLWQSHLQRMGHHVQWSKSQDECIQSLAHTDYKVIILNLVLDDGSALAVSDYASFRWPNTRIIFVTNTSFFSDGSIFSHSANACAMVPQATAPEDLAAMVDYHSL